VPPDLDSESANSSTVDKDTGKPQPASTKSAPEKRHRHLKLPRRLVSRIQRAPARLVAIVMVVILAGVISYAASRGAGTYIPPEQTQTTESANSSATPGPILVQSPEPAPDLPALRAAVGQLEQKYQVSLGVAIAAASDRDVKMNAWYAGTLSTGVAWATIDVPVAMAVLNEPSLPADVDYLMTKALSDSSGAGDDALWQLLGDNEEAATKTTQTLRQLGDVATQVPSSTDTNLPVYTQTQWTLANQASFAAQLYCSPASWQVLTKMSQQPDSDKWGLGSLKRTDFKSGWGNLPNGSLSVRQLGIVLTADQTRVGVSVAAIPNDGNLATAQAALTDLAGLIQQDAIGFPETC
jgi:hypothetical protein